MQNNLYFMEHLVNERVEARLKDAECYRRAKEHTTSLPVRRPLLKWMGRVFLTAVAAIQDWGVRRNAIEAAPNQTSN